MPRRRQGSRVLGPYPWRGKYRIFLCDEGGAKTQAVYATEKAAREVIAALETDLKKNIGRTIADALTLYEEHLLTKKNNKPASVKTTMTRLSSFFSELDVPLGALTAQQCHRYYERATERISLRTGKPLAADSHRNILAEARTFLGWCVKPQRWLRVNPLAEVVGHGRRRHGKPQLRIDEARRLRAVCHREAARGDDGAVAVLLGLLMGLRAGEIVSRTVRDVDDGGRILWVDDNLAMGFSPKTAASRRPVSVWEEVRGYLVARTRGRSSEALLFPTEEDGAHWRDWVRRQTRRLCRMAEVPVVCAHSLRGFAATLNLLAGVPLAQVAAALGHESPTTTLQSYAAPDIETALTHRQAQLILGPAQPPIKD